MKNLSLLKCISILWILLIPFIGYSQSINQSYPAAAGYTPYAVEASADGYHILSLKNRDTLIIEVDDKGQQLGIQKRDAVTAPIPPPGVNIVERVNNSEFMYMYNFGTTTIGLARVDQNGVTIDAASITFPDSLFTNDRIEDYVEAEEIIETPDGGYYLKVRTGDGLNGREGFFIAKITVTNGLGTIDWVHSVLVRYYLNDFFLAKDGNCFIDENLSSKRRSLFKMNNLTGEATVVASTSGGAADAGFRFVEDFEDGCTLIHDLGISTKSNTTRISSCNGEVRELDFLAHLGIPYRPISSFEDIISMTNFAVEDDYFLIAGRITTNAGNIEPYIAKANFDGTIEWIKILDFDLGYEIHEMNEINGRIFLSGLKYGTPFFYEVDDFFDLELIANADLGYNNTIEPNKPFLFTLKLRNASKGNFNATDIVVDIPAIPNIEILGAELSGGTMINTIEGRQWTIPTLASGETVTAIIAAQARADIQTNLFAEITAATTSLADSDSSPDNGNCCEMLEDDEINIALATIELDDDDCFYNYTLNSQEAVNELTCTNINRLTISGNDIVDLSPLAKIETIKSLQLLSVNTDDWSAFDHISEIENIYISTEISEIKNAFNQIECLEQLTIQYARDLERIHNSFQQLQKIETLNIEYNFKLVAFNAFPQLESLNNLYIKNNASLHSINGFNQIKNIEVVEIAINEKLQEIRNSFHQLEKVRAITIAHHPLLNHIVDFSSLKTAYDIEIENNPALKSLDNSFNNVLELTDLRIRRNNSLEYIRNSFTKLRRINVLHLSSNEKLSNLPSFSSLLSVNAIEVYNAAISEISNWLNTVTEMRIIRLGQLPNLKRIDNSFNQIQDLVVFKLASNEVLEAFDNSLSKLREIDDLSITDNARLLAFTDLPDLKKVDKLRIIDNPLFNDCCWMAYFIQSNHRLNFKCSSSTYYSCIENNASNCNSKDIIMSHCTEQGLLADLTLANIYNLVPEAKAGEVIGFNFHLKNIGTTLASGDYKIEAYLNRSEGYPHKRYWGGELLTGNTPIGTIDDVYGAITIPTDILEGNYKLELHIDTDHHIKELIESNNSLLSTFDIAIKNDIPLPDLVIDNIKNLPEEIAPGELLNFQFDLINKSSATAWGNYEIGMYFSTSDYSYHLGPNVLLGTITTGNTASGKIENINISWPVPDDIAEGEYYLKIRVDEANDIIESYNNDMAERNNITRSDQVFCIDSDNLEEDDIPNINVEKAIFSIEKESPSIFDIEVSTIPKAAHLITKIYPNPAQDDLHIQVESAEKTSSKLVIYNSIGQVVLEELVNLQKGRNELTFSLSDLQAGIYFAQIGVEQTTLSFVKN